MWEIKGAEEYIDVTPADSSSCFRKGCAYHRWVKGHADLDAYGTSWGILFWELLGGVSFKAADLRDCSGGSPA